MRQTILLCFAMSTYLANAQFIITPQLGKEVYQTCIRLNDQSSFSPLCARPVPQAGIRLDYRNKLGHGPYIGIATSRSVIKYNFSDPETGMKNYTAARGNTQFRLEGGYQLSTKPIYLKKPGANKPSDITYNRSQERKSCGNYVIARSSCAAKKDKVVAARSQDKGAWVRIQPSLGVAYVPFTPTGEIISKTQGTQAGYEYNAGNWNTAVTTGLGFEFGKNEQRRFVVTINYLKGLGNLDARSVATMSGSKFTNTTLQSNSSAWNLKMGIPINLNKKLATTKAATQGSYKEEKKCGQYRNYYRPHCTRG